jgi:hypothetical protein
MWRPTRRADNRRIKREYGRDAAGQSHLRRSMHLTAAKTVITLVDVDHRLVRIVVFREAKHIDQ